jgi:hypothetical protein
MILLIAVTLGLAATYVRARLTHRTLKFAPLKWDWLVIVCVIPQLLAFYLPAVGKLIPDQIIPFIQMASMFGLVLFSLANFFTPGFWALGFGLMSNFIVITANGGWMPISVDTLQRMFPNRAADYWAIGTRLGQTKDLIMAPSDTRLAWLSDRFTLPAGLPQNVAFSVGDVFLALGAFLLLWSLSRKEVKEIT